MNVLPHLPKRRRQQHRDGKDRNRLRDFWDFFVFAPHPTIPSPPRQHRATGRVLSPHPRGVVRAMTRADLFP